MNHVIALKCVTCGEEYRTDEIDYTCPKCGPLFGTLDVLYDYDVVADELTKDSLSNNPENSHWRYLPILPINEAKHIPSLAVGWTPIYRTQGLENQWDLRSIWIKDDGRNPTASFKDRASSVGVVRAMEMKVKTVTAASSGNAAASWSAFTALAKIDTNIFVPLDTPKAKIAQLLLYGAKVLQVEGSYDDAFDLCSQAAEKWGWYNRSTAINPYLGEGKKTAALEICEQLSWQAPDYIFVSVGDGCILQGTWKGFNDFFQLGFIDRLPKMVGVQAEGSAPLVRAWETNSDRVERIEPQTIADSISVGVPRDQVKALRAVRESGGEFLRVSDASILTAITTLAKEVGVLAEPAGAAGLAGLKFMVEAGEIHSNSTAVVLVTGNGLKDIDGVMKAVKRRPQRVKPNLDDVAIKLSEY